MPDTPEAKRTKLMANEPEANQTAGRAAAAAPVPPLQVKKLVPEAQTPTRGSEFAAGYDLYAAVATVIPRRGKALVSTGLAVAVPGGTCKFGFA